jgi:predicted amidohydrolase YtcJ
MKLPSASLAWRTVIVSTGLCALPLMASAQPAQTIYTGGDILTMEGATPRYVQALAVRDGRIVRVGSRSAVMALKGAETRVVELKGRTLIPGFVDSHSHLSDYAGSLEQGNLSPPPLGKVERIADIITEMKALKARLNAPAGTLLVGSGYDQDLLAEKRHPTAADLDAAFPNEPVLLRHASGHMAVANTAAMKLVGISAATPDPEGGTILRKPGSKEPEGLMQEMAMQAFMPLLNAPRPIEKEFELLKRAQQHYAQFGVTTAADHLVMEERLPIIERAAREKQFFIDVVAAPAFIYADKVVGTGRIRWGEYDNHLKWGGLKIAVDGSPQGKTAFVSQTYLTPVPGCEKDCKGFPNLNQKQLDGLLQLAYKNGVQLYSHSNGDAAVDMMIRGHEQAVAAVGDPKKDRRTLIIHSQIMRPDQLDTYKRLGLLPTFFTAHTHYWGDVHLANLGAKRAGFISPLATATKKGVIYGNHTDTIVTPIDQMSLLWTAVNRVSRTGQVVGASERVSPYQGLKAQTTYGAYLYFEEKDKGTLAAGKLADLVILDRNPLKVKPMAIRDIRVLETIKNGQSVYRAGI